MYRLDGVDAEVKSYFAPVAKLVLASRDPQEAMEVRHTAWGFGTRGVQGGWTWPAEQARWGPREPRQSCRQQRRRPGGAPGGLLVLPPRLAAARGRACEPAARRARPRPPPARAPQAALAALSGIKEVPEPRSLLTMEEGVQTLLMMSKPGRIARPAHIRCGPAGAAPRLLARSSLGAAPEPRFDGRPCTQASPKVHGRHAVQRRTARPHSPAAAHRRAPARLPPRLPPPPLQCHCGQAAGGHQVLCLCCGPHPHD